MLCSSSIADDVDPAPRLLRLLAACYAPGGDPVTIADRMRRAAAVLEGDTMRGAEANRPLGRLLARERRVRPVRNKRHHVVPGVAPRQPMSDDVAHWWAREVENGHPLDEFDARDREKVQRYLSR